MPGPLTSLPFDPRLGLRKGRQARTLKCYYRPNRSEKRVWSARAAARAVCAALEHGASAAELRAEFAECVPCQEDPRRKAQAAQAVAAMVASNDAFTIADGVLAGLELIVRITNRVARFVPAARAVTAPLMLLEARIGIVRSEIRVARAANESVIASLRKAA